MASAAAVATDIARSPLPDHEVNDALGTELTTVDDTNRASDDDDEDIAAKPKRKAASSALNGVEDDGDVDMEEAEEDAMDKDLFGSGSEAGEPVQPRQLDDSDLDSGDDENRDDRVPEEEEVAEEAQQQEELTFMPADLARHLVPKPSDGELYLLKIPRFMSIEPMQFSPETFQPPTTDHHAKGDPSSTFSAYNTALTTIRWRKSLVSPEQLQSNARILRWSDGSLTLQLASDPTTQYEMPGNALAPPQHNPPKPTPTSIPERKRGSKADRDTRYNPDLDSFTYLCAGQISAQVIRITNKFTAGLKIQPSVDATDEALERLQQSLAAAAKGTNSMPNTEGNIGVIQITEDPELQKKKAELAEKEKIRAQKRREAQELRERERAGRALGKRGLGGSGGLTVGGLEDDDELGAGVGGGRRTGLGSKRAKPRRQRRGEILTDEEEDYGRRGNNKEDEYDEEDDFVAPSDEEEEVVDDDEDEDEGIELEPSRRKEAPQKERPSSPKRSRKAENTGEDEADEPPADGSPVARSKRRRVIDEDEDDDE